LVVYPASGYAKELENHSIASKNQYDLFWFIIVSLQSFDYLLPSKAIRFLPLLTKIGYRSLFIEGSSTDYTTFQAHSGRQSRSFGLLLR